MLGPRTPRRNGPSSSHGAPYGRPGGMWTARYSAPIDTRPGNALVPIS